MYHHWILKCLLKKFSFEEIFIKEEEEEEENFEETPEEIIKKSISFLENSIKNSNHLPETFKLKQENEIEFDLGKFFFINENFEKAKMYLTKVNTKESLNMFNACESVLNKQKSEIEKLKSKILNSISTKDFQILPGLSNKSDLPLLDKSLLKEFFNLLLKDNFKQFFSYQERFNLIDEFFLFTDVKYQILSLNFLKLIFLNQKDDFFVPYFYQENFIKNFIFFSQKNFDLLKQQEEEEEEDILKFEKCKKMISEKIYEMLEFKDEFDLWKFFSENGKDFIIEEKNNLNKKVKLNSSLNCLSIRLKRMKI